MESRFRKNCMNEASWKSLEPWGCGWDVGGGGVASGIRKTKVVAPQPHPD